MLIINKKANNPNPVLNLKLKIVNTININGVVTSAFNADFWQKSVIISQQTYDLVVIGSLNFLKLLHLL